MLSKADCERLEGAPVNHMLMAVTADAAREMTAANMSSFVPSDVVNFLAMSMRPDEAEEWPLILLPTEGVAE